MDTNDTCDDICKECREKEEEAKTPLRHKLDSIFEETVTQTEELFDQNKKAGIKPDKYPDVKDFVALCESCPELDDIYNAGLEKELDTLYGAAELMTACEFEYIRKTDSELTEQLLDGPYIAFNFELDEVSKKRAAELQILLDEAGPKKTLLRRKLDHIGDETGDKVEALYDKNRKAGLHPNSWEDTDTSEKFNTMLKLCPKLDAIYAADLDQELDLLYEFAELMTEDEFEDIKKNDSELTEKLLSGPNDAFCFMLDGATKKEADRLRKAIGLED